MRDYGNDLSSGKSKWFSDAFICKVCRVLSYKASIPSILILIPPTIIIYIGEWSTYILWLPFQCQTTVYGNVSNTEISWGGLPHKKDGDPRRKFWKTSKMYQDPIFGSSLEYFFQNQLL